MVIKYYEANGRMFFKEVNLRHMTIQSAKNYSRERVAKFEA